jgi:hypothetical protein
MEKTDTVIAVFADHNSAEVAVKSDPMPSRLALFNLRSSLYSFAEPATTLASVG